MAFEFKFPDVGEGIHEGKILEWLIQEGNKVEEDQNIMKVETDKAVVDLPSPVSGTVLKIHASAGDIIHVGDVILTVGEPGETVKESTAPSKSPEPSKPETRPEPSSEKLEDKKASSPPLQTKPQFHSSPSADFRPLATPHTRALARKLGVDLSRIQGSGKGGRITDEDVEQAAARPHLMAPLPASTGEGASQTRTQSDSPRFSGTTSSTEEGEVERVPLSHLRKVIASAMTVSRHTSAHVTHVDEADVTSLLEIYGDIKARQEELGGVRMTLMPFFIKAAVAALRKHPLLNASFDEEAGEIVLKKYFNIGMAVDTPEGLIVPVVKNAESKNLLQLAEEVQSLALRARERRLSLNEIQGGTFTLTNIGPIGGLFATPIIHQPELAIVGLHTIQERPVVRKGEIVIRKMMHTSVSFDHRIIDGAEAARFMTDFVSLLSHPGMLMVRL
ncbi:MAG TPA: dihydrolipoamide acetyltransferase family protein [Thermoanaerobaculia bacterium]|nr:dihydrolipoamide acetyltransferase family protein [Thermoanaerobaculia bacterium]HUM30008.1 dihydrolipoamide acetyltransferase family protein [Thermoanaerobaculia bacterium]HXK68303.1 dihydrolipoamide acetyltransferase family protein [Thermoanaerobaculia bacterium]